MIRVALAVVAAVGLTVAADAKTRHVHAHHWAHAHHWVRSQVGVGPLCQDANGLLVVCGSQVGVGPLCQDANGTLLVCTPGYGREAQLGQVGPLCQDANGTLVVCYPE